MPLKIWVSITENMCQWYRKVFCCGAGNTSAEVKPRLALAAPVRIPHLDFTPLGARQTIRFQKQDIYNTAVESGVIAAEDRICENQPFRAPTKEADPVIAEQYNQKDKLGPRYAAYSIWRPLKKVGRDPLTLAPRRESGVVMERCLLALPKQDPGVRGTRWRLPERICDARC
jgi:hypothetical protein